MSRFPSPSKSPEASPQIPARLDHRTIGVRFAPAFEKLIRSMLVISVMGGVGTIRPSRSLGQKRMKEMIASSSFFDENFPVVLAR